MIGKRSGKVYDPGRNSPPEWMLKTGRNQVKFCLSEMNGDF